MKNQNGLSLVELVITIAILAILMIVLIRVVTLPVKAEACWFCSSDSSTQQQSNEQSKVLTIIQKLETAVPVPQLSDSLERKNISKRLVAFSDPNKVSYIYLVSYGKVMSFYTLKGKITSGSKRLTSTQRLIDNQGYNADGSLVVESPELDGTYGSSAPYIYFWTTDGVYVQWSGDYMLVDQPLQLSTPPEMVRSIK